MGFDRHGSQRSVAEAADCRCYVDAEVKEKFTYSYLIHFPTILLHPITFMQVYNLLN